jgi:hypothetical protein
MCYFVCFIYCIDCPRLKVADNVTDEARNCWRNCYIIYNVIWNKSILVQLFILSHVLVTETGFGLVIGFINRLQVVTTITYNTVPGFHNLQSLYCNLLSLHLSSLSVSWQRISTQELSHSQSSNITHKSDLIITRQFFAGWPLVFSCAPSPNSLCYSRASAAPKTVTSFTSPGLELSSFGTELFRILPVSLFI